jgi:hypothetical protein
MSNTTQREAPLLRIGKIVAETNNVMSRLLVEAFNLEFSNNFREHEVATVPDTTSDLAAPAMKERMSLKDFLSEWSSSDTRSDQTCTA